MPYPKLIFEEACKTPITVRLYTDEIGEDGEPELYGTIDTLCNYQANGKEIYDTERRTIETHGVALLRDDIFPELSRLTNGEADVFGVTYRIAKGAKERNPDGTVNYVRLELA